MGLGSLGLIKCSHSLSALHSGLQIIIIIYLTVNYLTNYALCATLILICGTGRNITGTLGDIVPLVVRTCADRTYKLNVSFEQRLQAAPRTLDRRGSQHHQV